MTSMSPLSCSADIPFNEGLKRPIEVTAPLGTILNPKSPAPVRAQLIPDARALAEGAETAITAIDIPIGLVDGRPRPEPVNPA